jgi:hypothetical protein
MKPTSASLGDGSIYIGLWIQPAKPSTSFRPSAIRLRPSISANGLVGRGRIRPRVIDVDGHAAYPQAIRELKASGELGRHASVGQLHT